MSELDEIFHHPEHDYDRREKFDYHILEFILNSGEQGGIRIEVECKGADKDDCSCDAKICNLKALIDSCGWEDVTKAAGDIPLGKVSARMDFTDYEEPWVELEP